MRPELVFCAPNLSKGTHRQVQRRIFGVKAERQSLEDLASHSPQRCTERGKPGFLNGVSLSCCLGL